MRQKLPMHARADAFVAIVQRFEKALVARADGRPETLFQRPARDVAVNFPLTGKRDEADRGTVRRNGRINAELACHDSTGGLRFAAFVLSEIRQRAHARSAATYGSRHTWAARLSNVRSPCIGISGSTKAGQESETVLFQLYYP